MRQKRLSPIRSVFWREINQIAKYPAYRFLLFFGPLIGIFLLFFIFNQGAVKDLPIAVVDQDHSSLSVKIANALDAASDVAVVMHAQDVFQAKKALEEGQIEAFVLIPPATEKSIYSNNLAPIPITINGLNVLKAGLIQRSVLTTIKTISGGIQLNKLMLQGKTKKEAMAMIMPVAVQRHVLFNPYTNYAYFLGSAMLYVMLYLFVFLSAIYTFGSELKHSTGQDLLAQSNNSIRMAIVGKILPHTIVFVGFTMLINYLVFVVQGMPFQGSLPIFLFGQIITIITYQLMGLIFIGVTFNLRLALSLGSAYSMMGITFSGLTFPLEAMPKIAQILSTVFPFTWWEKIVISQSLRGASPKWDMIYISYLFIFQLVALLFLRVYKHYLNEPKFWGKA
jgi:ABC-2 type transport system permease protein